MNTTKTLRWALVGLTCGMLSAQAAETKRVDVLLVGAGS